MGTKQQVEKDVKLLFAYGECLCATKKAVNFFADQRVQTGSELMSEHEKKEFYELVSKTYNGDETAESLGISVCFDAENPFRKHILAVVGYDAKSDETISEIAVKSWKKRRENIINSILSQVEDWEIAPCEIFPFLDDDIPFFMF